MQQMCRRARLLAGINSAVNSLHSHAERTALGHLHTDPTQATPELNASKSAMLDDWTYDSIMASLQAEDSMLISHKHADDSVLRLNGFNVVPQVATSLRHFEYKNRTYSVTTEHDGNSNFLYSTSLGSTWSGFVRHVWLMEIRGVTRTFLVVVPHEQLSESDQQHNPWLLRDGFQSRLVYDRSRMNPIIIEPRLIVSHAPCRVRPPGTYPGITRATLVVHCNLNLGRR
jgi:hypothetical protein